MAVWYNDNVIYTDKVRLNCYYNRHYSFIKDIEMIFATVRGFNVHEWNEGAKALEARLQEHLKTQDTKTNRCRPPFLSSLVKVVSVDLRLSWLS